MKLLIIGRADTIFLVNYVKVLKHILDIEVHVYSPFPDSKNYTDLPYDAVVFKNNSSKLISKLPALPFMAQPFIQKDHLEKWISDKYFDVIHIHRVLPAWVLIPGLFKKHCNKLYLSFWGGELESEIILRSHTRYLKKLPRLLQSADLVIGANDKMVLEKYPFIAPKIRYGAFGSSIIDLLCEHTITKEEARKAFSIPDGKISVLLGYSGKSLHNHIRVLNSVINHKDYPKYKDQIHFVASMTRGASEAYTDEVELALKKQPSSFTILRDCYQTDTDVAFLRLATDVLFQLSDFDYLSASVKEALCAGSVMISGSWLPYQVLKDDNFYFEEVDTFDEGIDRFYSVMANMNYYRNKSVQNESLCGEKYTWGACIKDWAYNYNNITE